MTTRVEDKQGKELNGQPDGTQNDLLLTPEQQLLACRRMIAAANTLSDYVANSTLGLLSMEMDAVKKRHPDILNDPIVDKFAGHLDHFVKEAIHTTEVVETALIQKFGDEVPIDEQYPGHPVFALDHPRTKELLENPTPAADLYTHFPPARSFTLRHRILSWFRRPSFIKSF